MKMIKIEKKNIEKKSVSPTYLCYKYIQIYMSKYLINIINKLYVVVCCLNYRYLPSHCLSEYNNHRLHQHQHNHHNQHQHYNQPNHTEIEKIEEVQIVDN